MPIAGRYSFETFEEYVEQRWELSYRRVAELIESANAAENLRNSAAFLPNKESHVRPLLALEEADRAAVWAQVVEEYGNNIRAKDVEAAVAKFKDAKQKDWVTLEEWTALDESKRAMWLRMRSDKSTFNQQDTTSIEWAQWSWNPVTGCRHDCPYCYARDIAERFYPQGFVPAFHPQRISAPANTKVPSKAEHDIAYRNVFACSMADLFGRWVPQQWIDSVLDVVRTSPQWNFLFLTKFPKRLPGIKFPDNAWVGTTVDCQARVKSAEDAFERVEAKVKWLSVEPMIEPLTFKRLNLFNWIVIGGASRSNETPEWRVPFDWWMPLHMESKRLGLTVYHKDNLMTERERGYPGHPHENPKRSPQPFAYLKLKTQEDIELGEKK